MSPRTNTVSTGEDKTSSTASSIIRRFNPILTDSMYDIKEDLFDSDEEAEDTDTLGEHEDLVLFANQEALMDTLKRDLSKEGETESNLFTLGTELLRISDKAYQALLARFDWDGSEEGAECVQDAINFNGLFRGQKAEAEELCKALGLRALGEHIQKRESAKASHKETADTGDKISSVPASKVGSGSGTNVE